MNSQNTLVNFDQSHVKSADNLNNHDINNIFEIRGSSVLEDDNIPLTIIKNRKKHVSDSIEPRVNSKRKTAFVTLLVLLLLFTWLV